MRRGSCVYFRRDATSIEQLTRRCIPVEHAEVLLTFQDIFSYSGANIPEAKAKSSASLEDKERFLTYQALHIDRRDKYSLRTNIFSVTFSYEL